MLGNEQLSGIIFENIFFFYFNVLHPIFIFLILSFIGTICLVHDYKKKITFLYGYLVQNESFIKLNKMLFLWYISLISKFKCINCIKIISWEKLGQSFTKNIYFYLPIFKIPNPLSKIQLYIIMIIYQNQILKTQSQISLIQLKIPYMIFIS